MKKAVICSDSLAALKIIQSGQSSRRQDLILEIMQCIGLIIQGSAIWLPVHVGVEGNKRADNDAKNQWT